MLGLWPKKLEFQKYLKKNKKKTKTDISLISFQKLDFEIDMIFEIMRVDSRIKKIVKQKEHQSSLQNLDRSDINTSRHFLKTWSAGGNKVDLRRKNKHYSDHLGKKMMIKWWICETEDNGVERKIIRWMSTRGKSMAD